MPVTGKVLEDSIRLSRIRRIKFMLYIVQVVLLVSMAFLFALVLGGATLKPTLYLPLDTFATLMVLLMLIICVESFFFRILEIRFARSSSARHLMAKNSIRRALAIAIVTGVFAIILAVPSVLGAVEKSTNREISLSSLNRDASFYSSDTFSWTSIERVVVTTSRLVHVYLVEDNVFQAHEGDMHALYIDKLNPDNYAINGSSTISVPLVANTKFHLILNDDPNPGVGATLLLERTLSKTVSGMIGLLMISFVAANLAWVVYLMPIERKYSVSSIYK
jgi:hypothetical protein